MENSGVRRPAVGCIAWLDLSCPFTHDLFSSGVNIALRHSTGNQLLFCGLLECLHKSEGLVGNAIEALGESSALLRLV